MRWFRRRLKGEDRKAYDKQDREVSAAVRQFKLAAELGQPASAQDRLEVRMIAWEIPKISVWIEEEMRISAQLMFEQFGDPEIETRVRKISLAKALSGLLLKMGESAVKSNNDKVLASVSALRDDLLLFLNAYRFKPEDMIVEEYLDLQGDLMACGEVTGVKVPGLKQMFKLHYEETAATIGEYSAELMDAAYEQAAQ